MDTLLDRAGGLPAIQAIVTTFVAAMVRDSMIGYLFARTDHERLVRVESELAARLLGAADVRYSGRPLPAVHQPLKITGGHFDLRRQLLREAMAAHGLSAAVRDAWLEHVETMRPHILARADDCVGEVGQRGAGLVIERSG